MFQHKANLNKRRRLSVYRLWKFQKYNLSYDIWLWGWRIAIFWFWNETFFLDTLCCYLPVAATCFPVLQLPRRGTHLVWERELPLLLVERRLLLVQGDLLHLCLLHAHRPYHGATQKTVFVQVPNYLKSNIFFLIQLEFKTWRNFSTFVILLILPVFAGWCLSLLLAWLNTSQILKQIKNWPRLEMKTFSNI